MILTVVTLTFSVLLVLASGLGAATRQSLHLVLPIKQAAASFYAARAGTARAIYAVKHNEAGMPSACGETAAPSFLCGALPQGSSFAVTVTNNADRSGVTSPGIATAPDGASVPPGCIYLMASGAEGDFTKRVNTMLKLNQGWIFPYALAANNTDGATSAVTFSGGGTVTGDIAANQGNINLGPNTTVSGTLWTTSGGTVSGGGTTGTLPQAIEMPPPPGDPYGMPPPSTGTLQYNRPGGYLPPGRYNSIVIGGRGTLTLGPGNYSINSLTVRAGGQLIIPPTSQQYPVKMWVYESLTLAGNDSVNNESVPLTATTCIIYGMPSLEAATVSGGSTAAYAFYAPYTDIKVSGNSTILGSVVGNVITQINGTPTITYDTALNNDPYAGLTTVTIRGWSSQ